MFHANHAIRVENYKNLVIASGHTDGFMCALYHFGRWIYSGLKKLWIVAGKSNAKFVYPSTHHIWRVRHRGSRHFTSNACHRWLWNHIKHWNKSSWTASRNWRGSETALLLWKRWFVGEHDSNGRIFLHKVYIISNRVPNIWWIETSCVSRQELPIRHKETVLYIHCYLLAYSQSVLTMLSLHASFVESIPLDPSQYGFYHDEDEKVYQLLLDRVFLPEDFPEPCNCLKCAKGRFCACLLFFELYTWLLIHEVA